MGAVLLSSLFDVGLVDNHISGAFFRATGAARSLHLSNLSALPWSQDIRIYEPASRTRPIHKVVKGALGFAIWPGVSTRLTLLYRMPACFVSVYVCVFFIYISTHLHTSTILLPGLSSICGCVYDCGVHTDIIASV